MSTNRLTVSASGLAAHKDYVRIFREYSDQLTEHGMEYEEADRRVEPVTITLLIKILVAVLTTTACELIKVIINRVCDQAKKDSTPPTIEISINQKRFALPQDREAVMALIDSLTKR